MFVNVHNEVVSAYRFSKSIEDRKSESLKERNHLQDLGVDGRTILKRISNTV
jgi:hypothetical protein